MYVNTLEGNLNKVKELLSLLDSPLVMGGFSHKAVLHGQEVTMEGWNLLQVAVYAGQVNIVNYLKLLPDYSVDLKARLTDWSGYEVNIGEGVISPIPLAQRCWPLAVCVSQRNRHMLDLIMNGLHEG